MYSPQAWYAQSKLANLLFSQELDARLHAKGVSANAVNPGAVQGELLRWSKAAASSRAAPLSPLFDAVERALLAFYWPEEAGGLSVAYAALAKVFAKVFAKIRGNFSISLIVRTPWRVREVESYALTKSKPPTTLGDLQNVEKTIG